MQHNGYVHYYSKNGGKPVGLHVVLYDASKVFDKVVFNILFNKLLASSICPHNTKLLNYNVYVHQSICCVKWGY